MPVLGLMQTRSWLGQLCDLLRAVGAVETETTLWKGLTLPWNALQDLAVVQVEMLRQ